MNRAGQYRVGILKKKCLKSPAQTLAVQAGCGFAVLLGVPWHKSISVIIYVKCINAKSQKTK